LTPRVGSGVRPAHAYRGRQFLGLSRIEEEARRPAAQPRPQLRADVVPAALGDRRPEFRVDDVRREDARQITTVPARRAEHVLRPFELRADHLTRTEADLTGRHLECATEPVGLHAGSMRARLRRPEVDSNTSR
jgi:hypothetical protein